MLHAGTIPESLGNLGKLQFLCLQNNKLTGAFFLIFWDGQCQLTNLFPPPISHQGAIPESLGNLVELEGLYLNDNQLEGRFPLFLGWSVPTDRPIFSLILRREHPCIFGQPDEFGALAPYR